GRMWMCGSAAISCDGLRLRACAGGMTDAAMDARRMTVRRSAVVVGDMLPLADHLVHRTCGSLAGKAAADLNGARRRAAAELLQNERQHSHISTQHRFACQVS